ncbi:MAG TPA: tetratricopeptide repeat protein [Nitrospiraceae bacterium]|jgi:Flp pilus assembly protein TadD|nr:tetratricopeptide repeat protein [Nitrospiraceae bacterium]
MTALVLGGCIGSQEVQQRTLHAPSGTPPAAAAKLEEGNALYAARDWAGAKAAYVSAIELHPTLAEAHYNLGLVLERLGDGKGARKHYIEAANLAPGHKVIWDAPPLRGYGSFEEERLKGKSFLDAAPR